MQKQNIIIVGGGISGLYAASLLSQHCNVTLLEASDRLGGRILDVADKNFGGIVKQGAEFIHGDAKLSFSLLAQAGIAYEAADGRMYSMKAGKVEETDVFVEGWDRLLDKMKEVNIDITLQEFLALHFAEDKYTELRRQAVRYAEGYDIADPGKVSVMALYNEWSADEVTYQLQTGYGQLITHLEDVCKRNDVSIHLNTVVKHIAWSEGSVSVNTANKLVYQGNKAIVTVALSVLQKQGQVSSISFSPTLDMHLAAAQKIGFGSVVKASIAFRDPFWRADTAFIFGDQLFQTWWTQMPYKSNVLTGWAGGSKAQALTVFSGDELKNAAITSVAELFDIPLDTLRNNITAITVTNWQQNEWSQGAYSYPTPATKEAREILNIPAGNAVYFAGEALYDGSFSGTVEAALLTAREVVQAILNLK